MTKPRSNTRSVKPPSAPLPPQLYVVREGTGDEAFLNAHEDIDGIDANDAVGIYELRETRTKRVAHTIE